MRGLLSVSFGTAYSDAREKTIKRIEARLRAEYPDFAFYSAWTSERLVAKVRREHGELHLTLAEAFEQLSADGVDDLVVSTTCMIQGREAGKVADAAARWQRAGGRAAYVARPLLSSFEDCRALAQVLYDEFAMVPASDALLLMGHGSVHAFNGVYSEVQDSLHALGRPNFFVAAMEGGATVDEALACVRAFGASTVYLAPLMIVAGDHANTDLAGDAPDSWKSRVEAMGLQAKIVMRGLGEYEGVRDLVCSHVQDALVLREVSLRG